MHCKNIVLVSSTVYFLTLNSCVFHVNIQFFYTNHSIELVTTTVWPKSDVQHKREKCDLEDEEGIFLQKQRWKYNHHSSVHILSAALHPMSALKGQMSLFPTSKLPVKNNGKPWRRKGEWRKAIAPCIINLSNRRCQLHVPASLHLIPIRQEAGRGPDSDWKKVAIRKIAALSAIEPRWSSNYSDWDISRSERYKTYE
jgi:hypothetical protein